MNKILNDAHFLTITTVPTLYRLDSKGRLMSEQGSFGKDSATCCQENLSGGGCALLYSEWKWKHYQIKGPNTNTGKNAWQLSLINP